MSSPRTETKPIKIFISYAHRDERFRLKLEEHLSILRQANYITEWHDRKITAGKEWHKEINTNIESSQVILLLISPAFMASAYCYGTEMKQALEKHELGYSRVIPILLRPVDWSEAPFSQLQALPKDAKPIVSWRNSDEAWTDVIKGIKRVCQELQINNQSQSKEQVNKKRDRPRNQLTLDSFTELLSLRFPSLANSKRKPSRTLETTIRHGYKTILEIDRLLQRTEKARLAMSSVDKTTFATGEVDRAIAFERPSYRKEAVWSEEKRALFKKYEHLLMMK